MTAILEELAAGRIDAAEAARLIDRLKADSTRPDRPREDAEPEASAPSGGSGPERSDAESGNEPAGTDQADTAGVGHERPDTEPWAAATDRPQHPTHASDPFPRPHSGEETQAGRPQAEPSPAAEPMRVKPVNTSGVERISVRAVGRRVRVVGETSVATLSADGPHVLRRNGSVLEVSSDGELGASLDGFSILRGAPRTLEDFRSLGLGKELLLKVNPSIVVDVEVTAGSLNTERVPHLGKIRVTAGGAKLLDVVEINDALIQAGQATIKGAIKSGRNRIRAESGSLAITLGDDSNVTVTGEAQLGKVSWTGGHSGAGDEVVMGNGSARLDVEVVMGHAQIRVGSDRTEGAEA